MLDPLRDFPFVRDSYLKGLKQGEAKGQAKSVLVVLESRGLEVTKAQRKRILSCKDAAMLDRWLRRAAAVSATSELLDS